MPYQEEARGVIQRMKEKVTLKMRWTRLYLYYFIATHDQKKFPVQVRHDLLMLRKTKKRKTKNIYLKTFAKSYGILQISKDQKD